jgi:hypothetical protein
MISLPVARAGERHILKLNPAEYPHLVENEKFFLDAAHRSGLSVPPNRLVFDADGVPGLLIARFDRLTVDGLQRSLAVEDGCQVLDRPPADKYRLGADRTFAGLAALCDASVVAGRDLIRQLAFAYLTGTATPMPRTSLCCKDSTAIGGSPRLTTCRLPICTVIGRWPCRSAAAVAVTSGPPTSSRWESLYGCRSAQFNGFWPTSPSGLASGWTTCPHYRSTRAGSSSFAA